MMRVAYAACGCRMMALLPKLPSVQQLEDFREEANVNGWEIREEEHERIGAEECAEHAGCACASIQEADPRRHFKGCPRRQPLPEGEPREVDPADQALRVQARLLLERWRPFRMDLVHPAVRRADPHGMDGAVAALTLALAPFNPPAEVPVTQAVVRSENDLMQQDVGRLLRALNLGDHGRATSCHVVMLQEIIPQVERLMRLVRAGQDEAARTEPAPMDCDCGARKSCQLREDDQYSTYVCGCPHHRKRPAPEMDPGDSSGPNVRTGLRQRGAQIAEQLAESIKRTDGKGDMHQVASLPNEVAKELVFVVRHFLS